MCESAGAPRSVHDGHCVSTGSGGKTALLPLLGCVCVFVFCACVLHILLHCLLHQTCLSPLWQRICKQNPGGGVCVCVCGVCVRVRVWVLVGAAAAAVLGLTVRTKCSFCCCNNIC